MVIEKKIKLGDNTYYLLIELEYSKKDYSFNKLTLKNYKPNYFDSGDFSKLITKLESNYNYSDAKLYDTEIRLMADALYLLDRIPFLSGIKDVYISEEVNLPYSIGYMSKDEIEQYANCNNVKMNYKNSGFKLWDERTWKI